MNKLLEKILNALKRSNKAIRDKNNELAMYNSFTTVGMVYAATFGGITTFLKTLTKLGALAGAVAGVVASISAIPALASVSALSTAIAGMTGLLAVPLIGWSIAGALAVVALGYSIYSAVMHYKELKSYAEDGALKDAELINNKDNLEANISRDISRYSNEFERLREHAKGLGIELDENLERVYEDEKNNYKLKDNSSHDKNTDSKQENINNEHTSKAKAFFKKTLTMITKPFIMTYSFISAIASKVAIYISKKKEAINNNKTVKLIKEIVAELQPLIKSVKEYIGIEDSVSGGIKGLLDKIGHFTKANIEKLGIIGACAAIVGIVNPVAGLAICGLLMAAVGIVLVANKLLFTDPAKQFKDNINKQKEDAFSKDKTLHLSLDFVKSKVQRVKGHIETEKAVRNMSKKNSSININSKKVKYAGIKVKNKIRKAKDAYIAILQEQSKAKEISYAEKIKSLEQQVKYLQEQRIAGFTDKINYRAQLFEAQEALEDKTVYETRGNLINYSMSNTSNPSGSDLSIQDSDDDGSLGYSSDGNSSTTSPVHFTYVRPDIADDFSVQPQYGEETVNNEGVITHTF